MNDEVKVHTKARHRARILAMQALYQHAYTDKNLTALEQQFKEANSHQKLDWTFFERLLSGAMGQLSELDALLTPLTDDNYDKTLPVERAILQLAAFELKDCMDVPFKSVLNEYIDLAKVYGAEEGYKFVNGVLNQLAKTLRQVEYVNQSE